MLAGDELAGLVVAGAVGAVLEAVAARCESVSVSWMGGGGRRGWFVVGLRTYLGAPGRT